MFSSDIYSLSLGEKSVSLLEKEINGISDYFKNKKQASSHIYNNLSEYYKPEDACLNLFFS
jgi:hypothetical protein